MTIPAKWQDHEGLADSFDPSAPSPLSLEIRKRVEAAKRKPVWLPQVGEPDVQTAAEVLEHLKANADTITFCAHCNEPMTGAKCQHCEGRFEK